MADMSNIASFNNSDGLPPWVVQKLNNNFWHVVSKIMTPEIVVVAGATFPDPRTDETLFYDTTTGDLYIWNKQDGSNWGWTLIDIGYIHVDEVPPPMSSYDRVEEYIWISTDPQYGEHIYIWASSPFDSDPDPIWVPLSNFVVAWVAYSIQTNGTVQGALFDWLSNPDGMSSYAWYHMPAFKDAVEQIIDEYGS